MFRYVLAVAACYVELELAIITTCFVHLEMIQNLCCLQAQQLWGRQWRRL